VLGQLFTADVTDFIEEVMGIRAAGEVLKEGFQSFVAFFGC
jgi:hypothetical protein